LRSRFATSSIIGIRKAISKEDGQQGQDMGPTILFPNHKSINEEPTKIIKGSEEIPFLFCRWRRKMVRGVIMGHSILLAESNIYHVPDFTDRLYVIERGEIVFSGKPEELKNDKAVLKIVAGAA